MTFCEAADWLKSKVNDVDEKSDVVERASTLLMSLFTSGDDHIEVLRQVEDLKRAS